MRGRKVTRHFGARRAYLPRESSRRRTTDGGGFLRRGWIYKVVRIRATRGSSTYLLENECAQIDRTFSARLLCFHIQMEENRVANIRNGFALRHECGVAATADEGKVSPRLLDAFVGAGMCVRLGVDMNEYAYLSQLPLNFKFELATIPVILRTRPGTSLSIKSFGRFSGRT